MRHKLIIIFLLQYLFLNAQYKSSIYSRWTVSPDIPILFNLINNQYNYHEEKISIEYDKSIGFGLEFLKYFPNKNISYTLIPRYFYRNVVLNTNPKVFYGYNSIQLNTLINYLISNKDKGSLILEDLTRYSLGFGLAFSYANNVQFERYINMKSSEYPEIIKKFRIDGLFSLGIIHDVFFNSLKRTTLSKINVLIRFPFFNQSLNFTDKYLNLNSDLIQFQQAKNSKVTLEIRYNHLIDLKSSFRGENNFTSDDKWNEVENPIDNYLPPIFNTGKPKSNYTGNFFFEYSIYNHRDSIQFYSISKTVDIKNKLFNSWSFGYTINFLGNYKNYLSKNIGQEILTKQTWRRNLFLSIGIRNTNIIGSRDNYYTNTYLNEAILKAGVKINRSNNKYNFGAGIEFFKNTNSISFINDDKSILPEVLNSGYFIAVGSSNIYLKIENKCVDFKIINGKSFIQGLSGSVSFGL